MSCRASQRLNPSHYIPSGLQPLLQGFGGSLGANAALPDASPPPELWVASSSQSCRIPYSSSGVLFSSGAARRMGGANGSRECAPLRDTHQFKFTEMMGFAKGSTHPTSRAIAPCGPASSRAQAKSRDPHRGKTTRRANHPKPVQPSARKYFAFAVGQITDLTSPVSPDERGGSRSSRTRGGMRWTRKLRLTRAAEAYGKGVWS